MINAPIRVLVADDHELVRKGIVRILRDGGSVEIVAEACDGLEAVELALAEKPDVVVTDLTMPRLGGLDVVRKVRKALPKCRILVLTVHHDEEYIVPIVEAGASGYLVKDSASAELTDAVAALARGEVYFGPEATKVLAAQLSNLEQPGDDPYGALTARERELFHLVAESRSTREIAAILGVAVKTANNHRTNMMRKLRLHDAGEVVRYAARKGLLPEVAGRPGKKRRH